METLSGFNTNFVFFGYPIEISRSPRVRGSHKAKLSRNLSDENVKVFLPRMF